MACPPPHASLHGCFFTLLSHFFHICFAISWTLLPWICPIASQFFHIFFRNFSLFCGLCERLQKTCKTYSKKSKGKLFLHFTVGIANSRLFFTLFLQLFFQFTLFAHFFLHLFFPFTFLLHFLYLPDPHFFYSCISNSHFFSIFLLFFYTFFTLFLQLYFQFTLFSHFSFTLFSPPFLQLYFQFTLFLHFFSTLFLPLYFQFTLFSHFSSTCFSHFFHTFFTVVFPIYTFLNFSWPFCTLSLYENCKKSVKKV